MNRILTLQVEIIDAAKASWIWESQKCTNDNFGIRLQVIQGGPIPEQVEDDD